MNNFPGEGLGLRTGIICPLGQAYPAGSVFTMCKLFGYLLNPTGTPVGTAVSDLKNTLTGVTTAPAWRGVVVSASINPADAQIGKIIGTDRLDTISNEFGYFELYVIQGLTVTVSCPSFGKTLTIDTTGHTTLDLSTLF